jgi:hypothetical protein
MKNANLIVIFLSFSFLSIFMFSCSDLSNIEDRKLSNFEAQYAIPLIHDRLSLASLIEQNVDNTTFQVAEDGKLTVLYKGDVLKKTMKEMFPPLPGIGNIVLDDTLVKQTFAFSGTQTIDFGIFSGDKIKFKYRSKLEEDITISMKVPEIQSQEGEVFQVDFVLEYNGETPVEAETPLNDLAGYHLYSTDNTITFIYDARRPNGERIKLDKAWMSFTQIAFEYVEGHFPVTPYELKGDVIPIGLYTQWVDGIMKFEDPKITVSVDNSFGFPVEAKVNEMYVQNYYWDVVHLESPLLEGGITFDFPNEDEIGVVKSTSYLFDTTNSNLNEIFSKKVRQLTYQVDAIVNPDDDPDIIGWMHESSFFDIKVAVEVPMLQSIDSLKLTDTLDIQLPKSDGLDEIEFKMLLANEFPIEMDMQIYFLDDQNAVLDSLFEGVGIHLQGAQEIADGLTDPGEEQEYIIGYDKYRFDQIKKATKIAVNPSFSTTSGPGIPVWIYDHYALEIKLGARFKVSE